MAIVSLILATVSLRQKQLKDSGMLLPLSYRGLRGEGEHGRGSPRLELETA
jgi:hypothetical protein